MKRIIQLIIILLFLQSCINDTEKKLKNNPWINAHGTKIIEVKGDSILITYVFKETEKYKFELKDNTIILNDSIKFGKIDSISDNLLKLGEKKGIFAENLFFPIKKVDYNIDTTDLKKILLSNPWTYKINDAECRLDLMEQNWFVPQWSFLWSTQKISNVEDLDVKDWTVKVYNGTLFLLMIERGSDLSMFQIMGINDSTLFTSASFDTYAMFDSLPVNIVINKISSVDTQKINQINNLLTTSKWALFDYEVLSKNYEIYDGIYRDFKPGKRSILYGDTIKRVYEKYYLDKSINYIFTKQSNGYLIAENDTLRRGKWIITKDGKYLFTNPPSFFNCLKIIELSDSFLVCEQVQTIEFLDERNYEKRYIREKLKRQKTLPNKQLK